MVEMEIPKDDPSCVVVNNTAPATLCSCGSDTFAMKRVPDAKTKSAPTTIMSAEGKPNAQYVEDGLMSAKNMLENPVRSVPSAGVVRRMSC